MPKDGYAIFAIRAPNWLGDSVLSLPAIQAVAEHSLRSKVVVLASCLSSEVIKRIPNTLVFGYHRPGGSLADSAKSILKGARLLRQVRPIIGVSFTKSPSSSLTLFLGRVKRRVGFETSAMAFLYTDRISEPTRQTHLVEFYCKLIESMGIKVIDRVPHLNPTPQDIARATALLAKHKIEEQGYICLFPGSSYGPSKRWPYERFSLLADLVADRFGCVALILGSAEDREICKAIRARSKTVCLCGDADIGTTIGLLKMARAAVSNDSGGMHLAAAVGTPVVGLFFSTDPRWTAPLSQTAKAIYKPLECSPCFRRNCEKGNRCTMTIEVDDVMHVIEDLIR